MTGDGPAWGPLRQTCAMLRLFRLLVPLLLLPVIARAQEETRPGVAAGRSSEPLQPVRAPAARNTVVASAPPIDHRRSMTEP